MTPKVAATGTSFKGAAQYYLHDKRQAGEAERLTNARVAWTETRNLVADDPEIAWRIMAATSKDQARIKAQAGVKATGAQSAQHVYTYSLSWHPDEAGRLTREDMVRAADETLKVLGADKHQALIVAHRDTAHPHVHVILNRVSPDDGRLLSLRDDRKKLSAWALAHERERGRIFCEERERRAAREPKHAQANDNARPAPGSFAARAAELSRASAAMYERHRGEVRSLWKLEKERRAAIYGRADRAIQDAIGDNKFRFRPKWSALGKRHAAQNRAFARGEASVSGIINNAWQTMRARDRAGLGGLPGGVRGMFQFMTDHKMRRAVLTGLQDRERAMLSAQQKADLDGAIRALKSGRVADLKAMKTEVEAQRAAQIVRQAQEKDQQRAAWRDLNKARRASGAPSDRYGSGRHKPPAPSLPSMGLAESFDSAAAGARMVPERPQIDKRQEAGRLSKAFERQSLGQKDALPGEETGRPDWRKAIEATRARQQERSRPRSRTRARRRDSEPD